jgi:GPI ethanolamine phosphate transferase 3 subunit O
LVPTLSLLLGLPIPFNNLGGPIPEAFLRSGKSYQSLATAARITAGQIRRYQEMYKASGKVDLGPQFEQRWHPAESQFSLIQSWSEKKAKLEWEGLYQSYRTMQDDNLKICRRLWARFDPESMIAGIAALVMSMAGVISYLILVDVGKENDAAPFFSLGSLRTMVMDGVILGAAVSAKFSNHLWIAGCVTGSAVGFVRDL